jgi:hypothetical protein
MYAGKSGRDHLGLGSVSSDQILPTLSPSINVLTFHPRYHSFYVFLLDEFWQRDLTRSQDEWISFFRPRDFFYSLGVNLCDQPEHGKMGNIVGSQKTASIAYQQKDAYDFDDDYIDSWLGGYGLYYRSVMAEVGLIYPGGFGFPYPIDVPSEYGKEVASSFRKVIQSTIYYKEYFDKIDQVPTPVLKKYIHRACLCQLRKSEADDRPLIVDTFLHHGLRSPARRSTFRLFLDIAKQTDGSSLTEDQFRQIIYFGLTLEGISYSPTKDLKSTALQWRYYQAREYYAFALNALWSYLCQWGIQKNGDIRPIQILDFHDFLDEALDFDKLAARLHLSSPSLRPSSNMHDLLMWLQTIANAEAGEFDINCSITCPINEHLLYQLAQEYSDQADVMIAGMISLLGIIVLRFGDPALRMSPEWEIPTMGGDSRLSLDGFIRKILSELDDPSVTIKDITRQIYDSDIILQHELVANSKLPENTFRFNREGSSLRFQNLPNSVDFLNSRFDAIRTTIYDLGLCGDLGTESHPLYDDGKALLDQGDL